MSKIEYMRILEIIGLGKVPLSSRQIEKEWSKKYSTDRNTQNSYIYEIIKKLHKPEFIGQIHPERLLSVTYKETAKEKIKNIEEIEKKDYLREGKIAYITNNPRNWRYSLNLKGFLLYLQLADEYDRIVPKTLNSITTNLISYKEFDFLKYFGVFGNADKIKYLVDIAKELKSNLRTYSREYLRYYIMKRCHEEISIWLAAEDDILIKKFSRFIKKKGLENRDGLISELKNYKIRILDDLIPIEQNILESMMIDRLRTKQSNLF